MTNSLGLKDGNLQQRECEDERAHHSRRDHFHATVSPTAGEQVAEQSDSTMTAALLPAGFVSQGHILYLGG